ncbi:MAG: hypothetical protein ACI8XO_000205 [Verrucomicrobiales bacterium]|jgi:hypothetical protein
MYATLILVVLMNSPNSQQPLATDDPLMRAIGRGENLVKGVQVEEVERVVHPPVAGENVTPTGNYPQRQASYTPPPRAAHPATTPTPTRATTKSDNTEIISAIPDTAGSHRRRQRNRKMTSPLKMLGMFAASQLVLGLIFFSIFGGMIRNWLQATAVAPDGVTAKEAEALREHVDEAEAEFSQFGTDLERIKKQISVEPGDAWAQLEILGARNELTMLADDAIANGSRLAYDKLVTKSKDEKADQRLRDGAAAEITRVKNFYASGTRLGSHTIPVATLYPSLKSEKDESLTNSQLIALLGDQDKHWRVRLRAAYLMGSRRTLGVAESLVNAVKNDPNLDVVEECITIFEENTGYRAKAMFEVESLLNWWTVYESRVGARAAAEALDPS